MSETVRCAVCARPLALVATGAPQKRMYCPDRFCYFLPSTAGSRAKSDDPTVSAWVVAMHYLTSIPDVAISKAAERNPGWAGIVLRDHRRRWSNLPY